jgi:hypothetical protein
MFWKAWKDAFAELAVILPMPGLPDNLFAVEVDLRNPMFGRAKVPDDGLQEQLLLFRHLTVLVVCSHYPLAGHEILNDQIDFEVAHQAAPRYLPGPSPRLFVNFGSV